MRALLDISVVLALLDADHVFHRSAHAWWKTARKHGWASTPLTENGVVRIMIQPSYGEPDRYTATDVISWLNGFAEDTNHQFWADDISLLDESRFAANKILGPKQLTDIYLLGLAVSKGGRLVTFDQRVTPAPVPGASHENLLVID